MHEVIESLTVKVDVIYAKVIHVLGDIGKRDASAAPPPEVQQHNGHYLTSDGEHYKLSDGLYYRVKQNS